MSEYLTTREVAALLRIKERKVYDLAANGSIPHSKAMGKLLFPRAAVETWLASASSGPAGVSPSQARPSVFLGSHDPLLEWALRESQCGLASWFDGSSDGLDRFERHEGLATGLHLFDLASGQWNLPRISPRFDKQPVVLARWASRQRGLIVSPDLDRPPGRLTDLPGLRLVPRQTQSGTQDLFGTLLRQAGIDASHIETTAPARTEADAALAVLEGQAQVAFGLESLAVQYRLPFVPVIREEFDLLIDRRAWFDPPMQKFLTFCRTDAFQTRASSLAGYDIGAFGEVRFNGY